MAKAKLMRLWWREVGTSCLNFGALCVGQVTWNAQGDYLGYIFPDLREVVYRGPSRAAARRAVRQSVVDSMRAICEADDRRCERGIDRGIELGLRGPHRCDAVTSRGAGCARHPTRVCKPCGSDATYYCKEHALRHERIGKAHKTQPIERARKGRGG